MKGVLWKLGDDQITLQIMSAEYSVKKESL